MPKYELSGYETDSAYEDLDLDHLDHLSAAENELSVLELVDDEDYEDQAGAPAGAAVFPQAAAPLPGPEQWGAAPQPGPQQWGQAPHPDFAGLNLGSEPADGFDLFAGQAFQPPFAAEAARRKGQERYVSAYKSLIGSYSPLAVLRRPGSSYSANGSFALGLDIISMALTAAAQGIPVPSSVIARLGPELELKLSGGITTGDDTKIRANLTLKLTGRFTASIAENLGLNANLSAGISGSIVGSYDSLEHFAARYLRDITKLISRVFLYSAYKSVKKQYKRSFGHYEEKQDLPEYREVRELAKRRRTRVKAGKLEGRADISAVTGLFGAGVDASVTGKRFTRKRNLPGGHPGVKQHEKKHGYVAEASVDVDAGPFGSRATLSFIHNDANPDNDGIYITLTLTGVAGVVGELLAAAPEALTDITFSTADTMRLLGGELAGTITKMNLPVAGVKAGFDAGPEVTMVWFQSGKVVGLPRGRSILQPEGKAFRLLYVRSTGKLGGHAGVSGIPIYAGLTAGAAAGGEARRATDLRLGHNSIAYVQALYLGMRAHQRQPWRGFGGERKDDWRSWARQHEAGLRQMMASPNVREELTSLANSFDGEGLDTMIGLDNAIFDGDFDGWLAAVEQLFDLEAARRRGEGGGAPGWKKYATVGDMRKAGLRRLR